MKPWKISLVLVFLALAFLLVGTIDYRALGLP